MIPVEVYWINHWLVFSIYCFFISSSQIQSQTVLQAPISSKAGKLPLPAKVVSYTLWPREDLSEQPTPHTWGTAVLWDPQQLPGTPSSSRLLDLFLGAHVCLQLSGKVYGKKIFWILECLKCLYFYPHTQLMTCLDWKQLCAQSLSHVQCFVTPWTPAHQVPLTVGFSTGVGCHFLLFTQFKGLVLSSSTVENWCYLQSHSHSFYFLVLILDPLYMNCFLSLKIFSLLYIFVPNILEFSDDVHLFVWVYFYPLVLCTSVQFSRSVVSNSLWPHELHHARPPCPSTTPGVHSNSRPSESVMPSSHLILCRLLLLLPPIPPSIRVFSSKSTLHMKWPKYWSFSFSISPSKEHPGLISFRMDWLDLLAQVLSI